MNNLEPKTISSIIVRPCYSEGKVWRKENPRFIGMIYVNGQEVHSTCDYDNESGAYNSCANHITRYYKKHGTSLLVDAINGIIKK